MITSRRRRWTAILAQFSVALLLFAAIGLGRSDWWLSDILANLRLHVLTALVLVLPIQLGLGKRGLALLTVAAIAASLAALDRITETARANHPLTHDLTVASYNLGPGFSGGAKVAEYFSGTPADIVVFEEYSFVWHDFLQLLSAHYPYSIVEPRDGSFGIALFSRHPFSSADVRDFPESRIPFISATVVTGDKEVNVLGVHLQWPMLPSTFAERNRQIESVIDMATAGPHPFVACGDWNMTPWSRWYRKLDDAGLHDGRFANRLLPTWPASLGWLGIPIDHCFTAGDSAVAAKTVGPPLGSDHRPISVAINLGKIDR